MRSIYKIIHTTCHTGWGGLEKRVFNESVWMKNQGHTVIIIAPKNTPLFEKAKTEGFKVYPVNFKRLSVLKDYQFLKNVLSNEKPDILNTHGNRDSKLALYAAKKSGVPCRILSRHISAHVSNSWYNRKLYKKLSHYVFTTADYTTAHLKKVFKLNEMQVFSMPSGIIVPETVPEKDDARMALAAELDLDPGTRFIGFAGRVSKDKGVDLLISAFSQIHAQQPGMHLAIAGDGTNEYVSQLKAQAKKLRVENKVHLAGFREDVWPFYRALDVKVLPSRSIRGIPFEGVPQALLEAMYCECPVVGSDSGGITDIINDKKTGLLFTPSDTGDLGKKILQTLSEEDQTAERVQAAKQMVETHHTIDAMGRNIIRIYRLHQVKLERTPY